MLQEWLPGHLRRNPDLTLEEHCEAFEEEHGVEVSTGTMSRSISPLAGVWPLKRSPPSPRARRGSQGLWRWVASRFDASRLVFVDESRFRTSMTRLRARAPTGERAYGKVPRNRGKNTTLIASITLEGGMGSSMTSEGATDAEAFEAYVEHFLAPTLTKEQVVVLDRRGAHRTDRGRYLIERSGADVLFLPTYSPDLDPIEEAFSKIKNIVRNAAARTRRAIVEAIAFAI
jgi:transposase